VDEILRASLPVGCPHCGGKVCRERVAEQYQTEIPPVRPVVVRFDVEVGRCRRCGRRVQGRHPRQTSTALGAAAHSIGPNALALAAHLSKPLGLSAEKIAAFFETAFHLKVAPSTLTRGIARCGERLEPLYRRFIHEVRHSDTVTGDETGWKVGGVLEWLWTFATPRTTVYAIRPSRGADVPAEILTEEFDGAFVHDGWAPYDRFERATHQTCLAHLLRRSHGLLEEATRGAVRFPRAVTGLLQDALDLRDRRDAGEVSPHGLAVATGRLSGRLDDLRRVGSLARGEPQVPEAPRSASRPDLHLPAPARRRGHQLTAPSRRSGRRWSYGKSTAATARGAVRTRPRSS
jgi:transposase